MAGFPLASCQLIDFNDASDGQSLCPLGLRVRHARQGSKNGSSTPIKPHMVLIVRYYISPSPHLHSITHRNWQMKENETAHHVR